MTGEERMQAIGKLLVLDRLLPNKDECLLPNLDR
jgi:hypothetical protein